MCRGRVLSRNAGGFYKDLEVVVTTAVGCQLGADKHGMRIVTVSGRQLSFSLRHRLF